MNNVTSPRTFMHHATKSQANLAAAMSEELKAVIYSYQEKVPVALALGVLGIVAREIQKRARGMIFNICRGTR